MSLWRKRGKNKRAIRESAGGWAESGLQQVSGDLRLHQEQRVCAGDHGAGGVGKVVWLRKQDLYQGSSAETLPDRQHQVQPVCGSQKQLPNAKDNDDQNLD